MRWLVVRLVVLLVVLLVACTPRAIKLDAQHPAHPEAEPGRLAGPPAALRPGVGETAPAPAPAPAPTPAPAPAPAHQH